MKPRYSIIPGGASTDPDLEGNDLRVLCFLGEHTDKLGWCFLSQGRIADALHIGRATVQRSLGRLAAAGYVEIKSSVVSGRPHACHAYRVIMDRDDPEIGPSESEFEDQIRDGGCPPAGTSDRPEVPIQDGHGCPPMDGHGVPTHTRAHNDQDADGKDGGDARVRESAYLPEAHRLSAEVAGLCGHDVAFLPPRWARDGARIAQAWITADYSLDMIREEVALIVSRKRDGPVRSPTYFDEALARAHALRAAPHQLPIVNIKPNTPQEVTIHDDKTATDWKSSRDRWRRAAAQFRAGVDAMERPEDAGG